MAILVSLLYGGGGEVWKPEGNWYIRLTTTLWIEVCIRNSSCNRSLYLWRYVSDTLAATGICLYGNMCQQVNVGAMYGVALRDSQTEVNGGSGGQ